MRVECTYDKLVEIRDIKPNPDNPNIHPREQIEMLSKILKKTGWRSPIVVSNLSGYIVKGHGRYDAAKMAGFTEVPVDFQDYDTEDEERADLLADNKLAELSKTDEKLVKTLLEKFDDDFDFNLTGYDESFAKEIEEVISDVPEARYPIIPKYDEKYDAIVIVCENELNSNFIFEALGLESQKCYKSKKVGQSRVITAKRFIELWKAKS